MSCKTERYKRNQFIKLYKWFWEFFVYSSLRMDTAGEVQFFGTFCLLMDVQEYGLILRGHVPHYSEQDNGPTKINETDLDLVLHSVCRNAYSAINQLTFVGIDVVWPKCTREQAQYLIQKLRFYLKFPQKEFHVRVHDRDFNNHTTTSLLETLEWVKPYAESMSRSASSMNRFASLLFLRADCILQSYFEIDAWIAYLPMDGEGNRCMVFPFETDPRGPDDTIFFLPVECWEDFERALLLLLHFGQERLHLRTSRFVDLPMSLASEIIYFTNVQADYDTQKEWNPFFVILGSDNQKRDTSDHKWDTVLDASTWPKNDSESIELLSESFRTCDHCWKCSLSRQCHQCKSWICAACRYSCHWHLPAGRMHECKQCNETKPFIKEVISGYWKCDNCELRDGATNTA